MIITNDTVQHTFRILSDAIARHDDAQWLTFGESVVTVEA